MNKLEAIIVDDELHARENLRFLIKEYCPEIEVVGLADGVENAAALFKEVKPQIIFLDIRMPSGAEGFDLLTKLEGERFQVIFVTAFKDYAIRAFERRALHYILKPIDENDLRETVDRLLERNEGPEVFQDYHQLEQEVTEEPNPIKRLTIHHSKGIKIVEISHIQYLESSGNCTLLHFKDGTEYLDTRTLKLYEAMLPENFYRVHRSYMINMDESSEILHGDEQVVVLKSGSKIPIARERKKGLIEAIGRSD